MALSARDKISRRSWLLAGLATALSRAGGAPNLAVFFDGDSLRVASPQLHFLSGQPLNRLKEGATVLFLSQITIFREDHSVFRRTPERLLVSFDLWEEKFKVTMGLDRSAARLSQLGAEEWCLDNLAISALGLAPVRPFWLRFELRAADPREFSQVMRDPGISIRGLIELFGRKPGADEAHWTLEAGPLRLAELSRPAVRGTRRG